MLLLKQNRQQLYIYSVFMMLFIVYHKEQSILQMHVCAMELTAWQETIVITNAVQWCVMPVPSTASFT